MEVWNRLAARSSIRARSRRWLVFLMALFATGGVAVAVDAPAAFASATKCGGIICMHVEGHGTYVDYIDGYSTSLAIWTGHLWFSDNKSGMSLNSPVTTFYNGTDWRYTINGNLPAGDIVCVTAYDTALHNRGRGCATVG
jgi:hypothetical protein